MVKNAWFCSAKLHNRCICNFSFEFEHYTIAKLDSFANCPCYLSINAAVKFRFNIEPQLVSTH